MGLGKALISQLLEVEILMMKNDLAFAYSDVQSPSFGYYLRRTCDN